MTNIWAKATTARSTHCPAKPHVCKASTDLVIQPSTTHQPAEMWDLFHPIEDEVRKRTCRSGISSSAPILGLRDCDVPEMLPPPGTECRWTRRMIVLELVLDALLNITATTSFSFIAWRYQHRALFASTRFATQSTSPSHNVIHPPHVMSVTRRSHLFLIFNCKLYGIIHGTQGFIQIFNPKKTFQMFADTFLKEPVRKPY